MATEVLSKEKPNGFPQEIPVKDYGSMPPPPGNGPDDPGDDGSGQSAEKSNANAMLAISLFIGADVMFFAGLIGAFIVFRFGALHWPPPGQPLLPLGVTALNTVILLVSGFTMLKTWKNLDNWPRGKVAGFLQITLLLGISFLVVQGYEWIRLVAFGVRLSSGVFGGTFYVLIGSHAVHVLGGVGWLAVVTARLRTNSISRSRQNTSIKLVGMYWTLVVVLWPVLYGLVYWN